MSELRRRTGEPAPSGEASTGAVLAAGPETDTDAEAAGHHFVLSADNTGCDADDAAGFRDAAGTRRPLLSLWSERRAIVVFLRHFGCRFCKQQVAGLARVQRQLQERRAQRETGHGIGGECREHEHDQIAVIGIGMGSAAQAHALRKETGFEGELYSDENPLTPATYATFSLKSGPTTLFPDEGQAVSSSAESGPVFRPEVAAAAAAAVAEGFRDSEGPYEGDTKQVGGAFVLGPGNSCDFAHRSKFAGDHVDLAALVAAATGCQVIQQQPTSAPTTHSAQLTYPSTDYWVQKLDATSEMPGGRPMEHALRLRKSLAERRRGRRRLAYTCFTTALLITAAQLGLLPGLGSGPALFSTPATALMSLVCNPNPLLLLSLLVLYALHASSEAKQLAASMSGSSAGADPAITGNEPQSGSSSGSGRQVQDGLELVTVRGVDALILAAGPTAIACDCHSLVESMDVETKLPEATQELESDSSANPSKAKSPAAAAVCTRARSASTFTPDDLKALQEFVCYMREFLAKPHPLLGRGGPTCPFVPRSLKLDSVHIGVVRVSADAAVAGVAPFKAAALTIARSIVDRFEQLPPLNGTAALHKAVVLLFPDVRAEDAHVVIDEVQAELKPLFVAKGLMIGEFHARNNASGLRNEAFFPLRTPNPALAVRNIVPSDVAFLALDKYEAPTRVAFLESYLGRFGERDEHGEPLRDSELLKVAKARQDLEDARAEVLASHGANHFARLFE